MTTPCKYDIPKGLSVSFSADQGVEANEEPGLDDVIEFQNDTASEMKKRKNRIVLMPCESLNEEKMQEPSDLGALLSRGQGKHRRSNTEFAKLESAFDHIHPQAAVNAPKMSIQ